MHIAFAIADGGPGVGLVRKPTKESDWRDVPLIDSVREAFERQLARRREQTGREPRPNEYIFAAPRRDEANPTGHAERSACRSARSLERDAPGPTPLRRDDHARRRRAVPDRCGPARQQRGHAAIPLRRSYRHRKARCSEGTAAEVALSSRGPTGFPISARRRSRSSPTPRAPRLGCESSGRP